jgi:GNAT superfamily N-acetyltransferase
MGSHESLIIRPVQASEFSEWAELYRGYRVFYTLAPDEAVIERVWRWITDPSHEVNALVAVAGQDVVGLAHYRRFARPSSGTEGLFLDDLFTAPAARGMGAGRALLAHLSALAHREGRSVVRWITAEDNSRARALYDSTATATKWVTYDMAAGAHDQGPTLPHITLPSVAQTAC